MRAPDARGRPSARGGLRLVLLQGALVCLHAVAQAQSESDGAVSFSVQDCEQIPGEEITKLIALELETQRKTAVADGPASPVRASLRCFAQRATITVEDARRSAPLVLEVDLRSTKPEARARVLALATAELIATSRLEQGERRATKTGAPAARPAAAPSPAARGGPFELWLAGGAARAFEPALFAPLLAFGVARRFSALGLDAGIAIERGQRRTAQALATARDLSLGVAVAWHAGGGPIDLGLGLGVRAGYGLLAASPRQPDLSGRTLSSWFVVPLARASLELRVASKLALRTACEGGYVVKPIRGLDADRATLLALRGLRITLVLGVAFWP